MMRRRRENYCTTCCIIRCNQQVEGAALKRPFRATSRFILNTPWFQKIDSLCYVYTTNHNHNHACYSIPSLSVHLPSLCLRFQMQYFRSSNKQHALPQLLNQRPPIAMQTSNLLPPTTLPFILLRLLSRRPLRIHHCANTSLLAPLLPSISNLTTHLRHGFDVLGISYL